MLHILFVKASKYHKVRFFLNIQLFHKKEFFAFFHEAVNVSNINDTECLSLSNNSSISLSVTLNTTRSTLMSNSTTGLAATTLVTTTSPNGSWSQWYTISCYIQKKRRINGSNYDVLNIPIQDLQLCDYLTR
jgi:hypothetical protein